MTQKTKKIRQPLSHSINLYLVISNVMTILELLISIDNNLDEALSGMLNSCEIQIYRGHSISVQWS
jgi:DNA gyrase/topoisomerase IV subunit B